MFNKKDSVFREGVDTLVGSNTIFTWKHRIGRHCED